MFTNEFEYDYSITTLMDDKGEHEDVHLIITDEGLVHVRQWDEQRQRFDVVTMSADMFLELREALQKPEGMFKTVIVRKE